MWFSQEHPVWSCQVFDYFFYENIRDLGLWFGFRMDLVGLNIWLFGHLGEKMNYDRHPFTVTKWPNHVCKISTLLPDADLHAVEKEIECTFLPDADLHQVEKVEIFYCQALCTLSNHYHLPKCLCHSKNIGKLNF